VTGETLFGFVQRVRIERAAAMLLYSDASVLIVALDHGFASAATFARAFRAHFGMTATAWRAGGAARWRRRRERERKPGKQLRNAGKARGRMRAHRRGKEADMSSVQVRRQPAFHVAFMRYTGPAGGGGGISDLWQKLTAGWKRTA
jgi:AraC family transcriptional regulator